MNGLTMDVPLTIGAIARRAEAVHASRLVVSRQPSKTLERRSYGDVIRRARQLAAALRALGVGHGDRVATLAWNHVQHLEAYVGIPLAGAVLHTLNLRLHPDDLAYIANDAGDTVLLVDETLLPLLDQFRQRVSLRHVVVMQRTGALPAGMLDYESLVGAHAERPGDPDPEDERQAAALCYTSGTTGRPKGVLYSHRAIVLHSLIGGMVDGLGIGEADTVLPVVPMFHVNAWGLPFVSLLTGANLVLPGPHLDAVSLLELLAGERVTYAAGVPTVWLGVLSELDRKPGAWDLSALTNITIGGSAAAPALIDAFERRHGLRVVHAWGMTESAPIGSVSWLPTAATARSSDERLAIRARQGRPVPLMEFRARSDAGLVPWDGSSMGELEMRSPWVASRYYNDATLDDRFTSDGWFRTGDVVTIDQSGSIEIRDRAKDLVKSGGEWISSIALENALLGHPSVAEAAVVAVPHAKWDERPLAVVVLKPGSAVTAEALLAFLAPGFAKWWLPDAVEFVDAIPRTSTGKFLKTALRERFRDRYRSASET